MRTVEIKAFRLHGRAEQCTAFFNTEGLNFEKLRANDQSNDCEKFISLNMVCDIS
jgi:hypothetical protein